MDTYQFAEQVYKQLGDDYTYENLIKVMEIYPDEFVRMMKKVHEKNKERKSSEVGLVALSIKDTIEEIADELGHHDEAEIISTIIEEHSNLVEEIKNMPPYEIVRIIEILSEEDEGFEGYHFHLFAHVLSEMKLKQKYLHINELIGMIERISNPYIRNEGIGIMTEDL